MANATLRYQDVQD